MNQLSQYDYRKLLGMMKERGFTQSKLAHQIKLSETSLNLTLNNNRSFKQDEITKICEALSISMADIPIYFFTHKI